MRPFPIVSAIPRRGAQRRAVGWVVVVAWLAPVLAPLAAAIPAAFEEMAAQVAASGVTDADERFNPEDDDRSCDFPNLLVSSGSAGKTSAAAPADLPVLSCRGDSESWPLLDEAAKRSSRLTRNQQVRAPPLT